MRPPQNNHDFDNVEHSCVVNSPLVVCWPGVIKLSLGEHVEETLALLWD